MLTGVHVQQVMAADMLAALSQTPVCMLARHLPSTI